jgi:hypothetical protein
MKSWRSIALALMLVAAFGMVVRQALREPEPVYLGKPIRLLVRSAVLGPDHRADVFLHEAIRTADPASKAQIEKELAQYLMKSLRTKDHPLWPPYNAVRTSLPRAVAKLLPTWQAPRNVRYGAVWWLFLRSVAGANDPAPPGLFDRAIPILCDLARNDRYKEIRQTATLTLGRVGTYSPEALQVMLRALNSTDRDRIKAGAKWFYQYPIDSERVVPLLVKGFENPFARGDCAMPLRVYGTRGEFAVERLETLAKTNDPDISPVAAWVLEAIKPKAAKQGGVK